MLHWNLHCATDPSVMHAQNISVRKTAASETNQTATCSKFHAAMMHWGLTLRQQSFHFACPKHSVLENCRIRNGSTCNMLNLCFAMQCCIGALLCATNLSVMLAQNIPVRKTVTSKTDQIAAMPNLCFALQCCGNFPHRKMLGNLEQCKPNARLECETKIGQNAI